ncbi:hypothetical protein N752_07335 [Desulforamulus aquiferis]|nr:hypothetical protein [Desulforamulus aquiferis]RYD05702.1 hypothetical protein N752_07335 [Desulforamulus aquiferis]
MKTVMVASNGKISNNSLASIFRCTGRFEIVGIEGKPATENALELQPDILVFEITKTEEEYIDVLGNIQQNCPWTKIILVLRNPVSLENLRKLLLLCHAISKGELGQVYYVRQPI